MPDEAVAPPGGRVPSLPLGSPGGWVVEEASPVAERKWGWALKEPAWSQDGAGAPPAGGAPPASSPRVYLDARFICARCISVRGK